MYQFNIPLNIGQKILLEPEKVLSQSHSMLAGILQES